MSEQPTTQTVLQQQVEALNAVALLSITAAGQARQQLLETLPLRDVQPSLTWVWQVLLHHCGHRMRAQAQCTGSSCSGGAAA